uniref:Uncharacterized protein n=1 Tax=Rhizobium rhizogenes TaxID=359 RepID=A0A7S5DRY8_RHIRH|nr:hypothetical protein pC5.8b_345 [Rhizobium rhizogenes]
MLPPATYTTCRDTIVFETTLGITWPLIGLERYIAESNLRMEK